jgi:hypothetical protein
MNMTKSVFKKNEGNNSNNNNNCSGLAENKNDNINCEEYAII